jgi:hypothetical protein
LRTAEYGKRIDLERKVGEGEVQRGKDQRVRCSVGDARVQSQPEGDEESY